MLSTSIETQNTLFACTYYFKNVVITYYNAALIILGPQGEKRRAEGYFVLFLS